MENLTAKMQNWLNGAPLCKHDVDIDMGVAYVCVWEQCPNHHQQLYCKNCWNNAKHPHTPQIPIPTYLAQKKDRLEELCKKYKELNQNVEPRYIKIQKFVHSLENSIYNIGGPQLGFKLR